MASSATSTSSERLALVSSLYGPGNVACWYLTILSVILSWTLHPRKRSSGSIDVNIIAVLTFFGVAAGHFLTQARYLVNQAHETPANSSSTTASGSYSQLVAAIEAPLTVLDVFMTPSAILACTATWSGCMRRLTLICFQGGLRGIVLLYIRVSGFADLGLQYNPQASASDRPSFTRFFIGDFPNLIFTIMVAIFVVGLVGTAVDLTLYSLKLSLLAQNSQRAQHRSHRHSPHFRSKLELERFPRSFLRSQQGRRALQHSKILASSIAVLTALFSSFTVMHLGTIRHESVESAQTISQALRIYVARMGRNLFPQTTCSITDLDQAVALATGTTVLVFCVYDIATFRYGTRKNGDAMPEISATDGVAGGGEENVDLQ